MAILIKALLLMFSYTSLVTSKLHDEINEDIVQLRDLVMWPNAIIPFYVEKNNFDQVETETILSSLFQMQMKTCLKFRAVIGRPDNSSHVLVFQNPTGVKRCSVDRPHSVDEPHIVTVGYECLSSPSKLGMQVMRALGFTLEHTRPNRDQYINVLLENVEPGFVEFYTKDNKLPSELDKLPYDINSVLHFGQWDYSKNGHKTFIIRNHDLKQTRSGLTVNDAKKIEIVYGPECRKRDRLEKVEQCQKYPAVARRKRNAGETSKSLRANPDITPPTTVIYKDAGTNTSSGLKELGIENEVQEIVDSVFKVAGLALKNARTKYCHEKKTQRRSEDVVVITSKTSPDILGILESVTNYAKSMVDHALANLTEFCQNSGSVQDYARSCLNVKDPRCRPTYRSTKIGKVIYSTQHRPYIKQSTKHISKNDKHRYALRTDNKTESTMPDKARRKRDVTEPMNTQMTDNDVNSKRNDSEVSTKPSFSGGEDPVLRSRNKRFKKIKNQMDTEEDDAFKKQRKKKSVGKNNYNTRFSKIYKSREEYESEEIGNNKERKPVNSANSEDNNDTPMPSGESDDRNNKKTYNEDYDNKYQTKNYRSREENEHKRKKIIYTKPYDDRHESRFKKRKEREGKKVAHDADNYDEEEKELDKKHDNDIRVTKNFLVSQKEKETQKYVKKDTGFRPKTVELSKLTREFYTERMWPNGIVRYIIQKDDKYDLEDLRSRLDEVSRILKDKTCVQLEEVEEGDAEKFEDVLVLDTSPDYVTGRVGGKQFFGCLELFHGGQHRQHTAMMVMAMLGFYFEVAREDRDKHIRVHMRHVRPDKLHHFEKIRGEATFPLRYDYESASHPAWQFWRKVGKTGISTVATYKEQDPDGNVMKSLGQHEKLLSDLDLVKINSVYGTKCFYNGENN